MDTRLKLKAWNVVVAAARFENDLQITENELNAWALARKRQSI